MIRLWLACRKISVSRTTGTTLDAIRSASTEPGPTEGSWSTSPTRMTQASLGIGSQDLVAENDIDHRRFVQHEQIAGQRMLLVAFELARGGIELQQTMDGLGGAAGRLGQSFGRPTRGCRQHALQFLGGEDFQDAADQRRLADARPARDDQQLVLARLANRFLLAGRQLDAQSLLDPGDGLLHVDPWQWMREAEAIR